MTRDQETALIHAWHVWKAGRVVTDDVYLEFFDDEVRRSPRFARIHVFEVLDALVNSVDPDHRESA
jgi:hypothetical protein